MVSSGSRPESARSPARHRLKGQTKQPEGNHFLHGESDSAVNFGIPECNGESALDCLEFWIWLTWSERRHK